MLYTFECRVAIVNGPPILPHVGLVVAEERSKMRIGKKGEPYTAASI